MKVKKIVPYDQFQQHLEGVHLSPTAATILKSPSALDPSLGLKIFLDRYSKKAKRETVSKGDLVLALIKDGKWPKKQIGVVVEKRDDEVDCLLLTGDADAEAGTIFTNKIKHVALPKESPDQAYRRVAKAIASVEKPEDRKYWEDRFYDKLFWNRIQPAGRIMTGAIAAEDYSEEEDGELTLFNCYVIPSPNDSRGGIMNTLHEMTEIMSRGGGVGINISTLRPKRAYVKGVRGESSGAVSWGGLYSYTTGLIEQGGSRRGALMLMMWDWHPDVLSFISAKEAAGQIENANISVLVSNAFMEAVKNDSDWTLKFPDTKHEAYDAEWDGNIQRWTDKGYPVVVYDTVPAREIWNKIIASAWKSAEPGVVFMEYYNDMSNSWYFNEIICTNPCGEQGLPAWGVCNLSHLNLAAFYDEELFVDYEELEDTIIVHARFLDNVIDLTPYHFKENEDNQKNERRVGAGTLGLAELLIRNHITYGSNESLSFIDHIYGFITETHYLASAELAEERGSFPAYNEELFLQSGFMKMMAKEKPLVVQAIKESGMRNVTCITQAPTGTVGSMLGTSTGIEPYFAFEYYRQSRLGFDKVLVPLAQEFVNEDGILPEYFIDANQLTPEGHIRVQAAIQKWCDSSISKTCNVPGEFTIEQTAKIYEYAFSLGCKGVTIYRDGSRDEQVLHLVKHEEKQVEDIKYANEATFGFNVGDKCGNCREGVISKFDGCTKCTHCDYVGACDLKL